MSRNYYYSIAEEDVYVLLQAALEKTFMAKLVELTRTEIRDNLKKYHNICSFVFKPFGYSRPNLEHTKDHLTKNNDKMLSNLN